MRRTVRPAEPGTADVELEPAAPRGRAATREDERARVRRGLRFCLKVFLALRIAMFLLGVVATGLLQQRSEVPGLGNRLVDVPGWPAHDITPGWHNAVTAFERQDALWFLRIADQGYSPDDGSAAFFPLYPLLVRIFAFLLGGHPLAGGLVVSNLAFLGALFALYFLTSSELSERAARRAVVYVAVFPTSFYFLAPYSESLFLLVTVAAFWAARRGRWPLAAVFGLLAAGTRSIGVLLVVALGVEAVHQWRERRHEDGARRELVRRLGWSAAPVLSLVGYLGYWAAAHGDLWQPLTKQAEQWDRHAKLPFATVWDATRTAFDLKTAYPAGYYQLDWLVTMPCLLLAAYAAWRFRPAYGVFTWASLLVPLSFVFEGRPFMSVPRFVLVQFPIAWALAELVERRRLSHTLVVAVSATLLGILTILFVNWYFTF